MSGSTFTLTTPITLDDATEHLDVYVRFADGKVELFEDETAETPYPDHPKFPVDPAARCALYFRMTSDTASTATFPEDPFQWTDKLRPQCIGYEKMTPDRRAFSILDDNSPAPETDVSYGFKLLVDDGDGTTPTLYAVDPTILNKGEGSGGGMQQ